METVRLFTALTWPLASWALVLGCESGSGTQAVPIPVGATGGAAGAITGGAAGALAGGGGTSSGAGGEGAPGGEGGASDDGGMGAMGGLSGTAGIGGAGAGGTGVGGSGKAGAASGGAGGGAGASSGTGGAATSGAGGMGGSAGAGGRGGVGGSGGSFGGWAGAGGPVAACAERCEVTTDCKIFSLDQGYHCSAAHRCERFAEPCRASDECIPDASLWIFSCGSDTDCFFFSDDLCVDVGGVGRCARLVPSVGGCDSATPDAITLPRFGASGTATVCANTSQVCVNGGCIPGCRSNTDCSPERNGSVCDVSAGVCRCVHDEDCGGPGVSHCNTATGLCECAGARDCEEIPNANACLEGRCGCSGVTACNVERTFSGTTYVCE